MAIKVTNIQNKQEMEVVVGGPNGANRLFIYTGTAEFLFKGTGENWEHDSVSFTIGRHFAPGQVHKVIVTASPARISYISRAAQAGWLLDSVDADWMNQG